MNQDNNPLYAGTNRMLDYFAQRPASFSDDFGEGVYIEGGANVGGAICVSHGKIVHAFEPVPDVFEICRAKFKDDPRVFLNQIGLSDRRQTIKGVTVLNCWTVAKTEDNPKVDVVPEYVGKKFDIRLVRLDDYAAERNLKVDCLKLDVDGYEMKALCGASNIIERDRPPIAIELSNLCRFVPLAGTPEQLVRLILDDLRYDFFSIDGKFRTRDFDLIMANYPWHTSYDVFLVPREQSDAVIEMSFP